MSTALAEFRPKPFQSILLKTFILIRPLYQVSDSYASLHAVHDYKKE